MEADLDKTQKAPPTEIQPDVEKPKEVPPPATDTTDTTKKKSTLATSLFIIIVLLATGVAGYFGYQNYVLKDQRVVLTPPPDPPVKPTDILNPTATAAIDDWISYSDGGVCYTFKYPQNLEINTSGDTIHLSLWGPTQKKDTEFFDGISLMLAQLNSLGNASLSDYVDTKIEESKVMADILKPKEAVTVNGIGGYTYTSRGLGAFQNIYLQSNDKTCSVEITNATADPTNQGYQAIVDKILSSLKFN